MQPDIVAYKLTMALGMIAVIVIPVCIIAQTRVRAFVGFREREYKKRLKEKHLVQVPEMTLQEITGKLKDMMPFTKYDLNLNGNCIVVRCYIDGSKKLYTVNITEQDGYFVLTTKGRNAKYIVLEQIEDALSMACWNKHFHLELNPESELFNLTKREKFYNICKLIYGVILAGFVAVIAYGYSYVVPVNELKSSTLDGTTISVEGMVNQFLGDPEWHINKSFFDKNGFITISGKCYRVTDSAAGSEKLVNAEILFYFTETRFVVNTVRINGVELDDDACAEFMEDMYKDHLTDSDINSLGDWFSALGDTVMGAINDSLFGHYVSYYTYADGNNSMQSEQAENTSEPTSAYTETTTQAETEPSSVAQETTAEETTPEETPAQSGQQTKFATIDEYSGPFDISIIPNTVWSCTPDDMTSSKMTITENDDGSLHLAIEATSTHNPYVNNFSGNSVTISGAQDADLYIVFETDGQDPDGVGDQVEVTWYSMEAADFPQVKGGEDGSFLNDYLYDGQYNWEYDLQ